MKIETKFKPGDKVWVMKDNKPYQFEINGIEIYVSRNSVVEEIYSEREIASDKEYLQDRTKYFATKKELLDSFLDK